MFVRIENRCSIDKKLFSKISDLSFYSAATVLSCIFKLKMEKGPQSTNCFAIPQNIESSLSKRSTLACVGRGSNSRFPSTNCSWTRQDKTDRILGDPIFRQRRDEAAIKAIGIRRAFDDHRQRHHEFEWLCLT